MIVLFSTKLCILEEYTKTMKLHFPEASASSMRFSQSAVEATTDYLRARVAHLSYLNPDEANRNSHIYSPKRWTIKVNLMSCETKTDKGVHAVVAVFVWWYLYSCRLGAGGYECINSPLVNVLTILYNQRVGKIRLLDSQICVLLFF